MLDDHDGQNQTPDLPQAAGTVSSPSATAAASPQSRVQEYTARLRVFETRAAALNTRHIRLGYVRLVLAVAFLATAWAGLLDHYGPRWLCVVPAVLFLAVAAYHSGIVRGIAVAQRSQEVYRKGMARIEDRWQGSNPRSVPPDLAAEVSASLYAADLDIVGRDGVFELLCTARTPMGEERLLRWLLAPAILSEVRERQRAIAELCGRPDFRERMAVAGDAVPNMGGGRWKTESLLEWAEAPDALRQRWWPWLAAVLAGLAVAALALFFTRGVLAPLFLVLVVEAGARLPLKREIGAVLDGVDHTLETMQLISALLKEMERESFASERLKAIQEKLASHSIPGSIAIAQLASLGRYRDSMDNPIIRVLNLPLLYSVQLAFAVQRWRRRHGRAARRWLEAVGEMEALLSLATYSYEHPGDPFPLLSEGDALFDAIELGHPLLPSAKCVRNDVHIGGETRVLLVSGSNMSGKSTLMRAVGVNTVLAMCGAPARARSLRLSPLNVGASLLVNDSLKSGQSRFYAEIERLSRICSLAEARAQQAGPVKAQSSVLFLLDELLQGTNSRDRLTGARGVLGALVHTGAIGIVTTHDLALTQIDGLESGAVRNMHFQEQIADGQMKFDFKMREGVVATSNGAELMRLIGLKV